MSSAGLLLPTAPPNSAPINEVTIGADGRYAFVEFRSVFEAGNVLMLDGLTIIGSTFRVQRPKDYTPAPPELVMTIIPPHIANANAATLVQGIGFSGSGASSGILGSAKSLVNTQAQTPENELIALHGMTRRARRLHVGNLPQGANLTPQMLQQYLNGMLISKGLHDHRIKGDPVVACNIPQGKFGFIELRTVHETTAALTLDGVELGDNHLKVQRPHDYQPVPDEIIKKFAKLSGHPDPQDFKANGPSHKTTLKGGAGDTKAPEGT
uniref:RRM domain-containing protein n=1 Tax=Amorphochlora amoebiformis TaxID=1561963 RepID=A0A7S0DJC4_9EUKA|mmetsp:Transcript_30795/g.49381  ORF Transcript_30795/g.49381 Transcript_30795/m.49381 type:complete len:267 (+) Transcript_30795:857-1657(+)